MFLAMTFCCSMKLSKFGEKLTAKTGILELMEDLGNALHGKQKMLMLGGGNPARIPEVETVWRNRMEKILKNKDEYERMLGLYTTPQGDDEFMKAIALLFNNKYGWNITKENVCVLGGSQMTFFFLFNMIAGKFSNGNHKKILLPLVPEYIGYADQGIEGGIFTANKPILEYLDDHTFKYFIDFKSLSVTSNIAAICVSRPTNPTGNVVTDEEVQKLYKLAKQNNIPLIKDNAYGIPFPGIIFTKSTPFWDENIIYVMSLSKLGLPSTRTSIVIAKPEVVKNLSSINAIVHLSTATVGQHLVTPLIQSGEILHISQKTIKPFYEKKAKSAIEYFHKQMNNSSIPYYLHKAEGALFLWLWCKDLPITSYQFYQRLKKQHVLVVPGEYFFPGFDESWKHTRECIRITYSQDKAIVLEGLKSIANELKSVYK